MKFADLDKAVQHRNRIMQIETLKKAIAVGSLTVRVWNNGTEFDCVEAFGHKPFRDLMMTYADRQLEQRKAALARLGVAVPGAPAAQDDDPKDQPLEKTDDEDNGTAGDGLPASEGNRDQAGGGAGEDQGEERRGEDLNP